MSLAVGTRLGPYELLAPIGAGAMGEVYKARDTRLNRDVAIKVLPPIFARDPDRLARFEREGRAVALVYTTGKFRWNQTRARFSPDGKWIAYVSDESNHAQVYLRSFPDDGTKIQLSTTDGDQPEWRGDGKAMFYLSADGTLMTATLRANGGQIAVEGSEPLFQTNLNRSRQIRNAYTASADGQRFLMMEPLGDSGVSPLIAVLNWTTALTQN